MGDHDQVLDFDDDFRVEPGDMLYKPLRKGNAVMLNAGTILTADMIHKIGEAGLLDVAARCIKKAVKDPGGGAVVSARYDAEIDKSQRIRDSLSGLRSILWLLLVASGGYAALSNFANFFYVYLSAGIFVAIVVTYLVSWSVYEKQTELMKQKTDRIKDERRRAEQRVEYSRQERIDEARSRPEGT